MGWALKKVISLMVGSILDMGFWFAGALMTQIGKILPNDIGGDWFTKKGAEIRAMDGVSIVEEAIDKGALNISKTLGLEDAAAKLKEISLAAAARGIWSGAKTAAAKTLEYVNPLSPGVVKTIGETLTKAKDAWKGLKREDITKALSVLNVKPFEYSEAIGKLATRTGEALPEADVNKVIDRVLKQRGIGTSPLSPEAMAPRGEVAPTRNLLEDIRDGINNLTGGILEKGPNIVAPTIKKTDLFVGSVPMYKPNQHFGLPTGMRLK